MAQVYIICGKNDPMSYELHNIILKQKNLLLDKTFHDASIILERAT